MMGAARRIATLRERPGDGAFLRRHVVRFHLVEHLVAHEGSAEFGGRFGED
jgi:hypothetical protein